MQLFYRAGTTIYLDSNGVVHMTVKLSEQEVQELNSQDLTDREILTAFGIDFSDTEKVKDLISTDLFTQEGNLVYRKGIKLSVPKLLINAYHTADDEKVAALDNFWKWCALNPNPEARQSLFDYLVGNGLEVTDSGMIITYRNVNIKSEGNRELHDFIVNQHLLVRTKWRKSTKKYFVIEDTESVLKLVKADNMHNCIVNYGTLNECYKNLEDLTQTVYTDAHTGRMKYKIGEEYRMPRVKCDSNSDALCSYGIHCGSLEYMKKGNFGSTGVICLVNPMDVVSIPHETNAWKMRTCAFMPIALVEYDENGKVSNPITETIEDSYTQVCIDNLNEQLAEVELSEFKVNELNIEDVANMVLEVTDAMKDQVQKRNVTIEYDYTDVHWENDYDEEDEGNYDSRGFELLD